MWISRHGTASDEDEVIWNNFDCGETVKFLNQILIELFLVIFRLHKKKRNAINNYCF